MKDTAVLLLAHGSPDSVDDVPDFLLRVTGGRPLPPDAVEEVKRRYSLIGRSPLTEITLKQMIADHIRHAVVICLAPQNSRTSVGLYRNSLGKCTDPELSFDFVESW